MERLFATYVRKIHIMERTMERTKKNKPVKPVKEHWRSGIQSKFLDAALQKKCQTQAELAYTNDWWKYKKLEMSKKEIVVSQLCWQDIFSLVQNLIYNRKVWKNRWELQ